MVRAQIRLFALFETFDFAACVCITLLTAFSTQLRAATTSLICTQASQSENSWIATLPLEDCYESLSGMWSSVTIVLCLACCLKAHATLVVRCSLSQNSWDIEHKAEAVFEQIRSLYFESAHRLGGDSASTGFSPGEQQPGIIMLQPDMASESEQILQEVTVAPPKQA